MFAEPASQRLAKNEIHIWRVRLRAGSVRATTRKILAAYAELAPREIELTHGAHGKPVIANRDIRPGKLDFSVSHSGELAVIGVGTGGPLGVDVERAVRPMLTDGLIERCFTATEKAALRELPDRRRHVATLRIWTAKEAYLKALGVGISVPLAKIDVAPVAAGERVSVAWGEDDTEYERRFWVGPLSLEPGHVGAVATRVARPCVTVRDWAE